MAYGMQIYNTDNSLAYDSTSAGGVFVQYIIMPPGDGSITPLYPTTVSFPLDWAPGEYIPGGPQRGRTIMLIPLIIGTHGWDLSMGYYENGAVPRVQWYEDNITAPGIERSQTILMVFVK